MNSSFLCGGKKERYPIIFFDCISLLSHYDWGI